MMLPIIEQTTFSDMNNMRRNNIVHIESKKWITENSWKDILPLSQTTYTSINFKQSQNLVENFLKEIQEKKEIFDKVNHGHFIGAFFKASAELLKYSPKSISVEITHSTSIFFFSKIYSSDFYVEIFFDDETGLSSETILNIYENGKQKLSDFGSFQQIFESIKSVLGISKKTNTYWSDVTCLPNGITPVY